MCVCSFPLFLSLKDVFLSHQFGSSISESLTIHRCAFVEREWKGAHYILLGSFSPSIFNNSMTVWQQKLVPICPLWQRVYHYGGTKASHPATIDNIFMHQQFVWKTLLSRLQTNLVISNKSLLFFMLAKLIYS